MSHWVWSCPPQTHAAWKMPAPEPGPLLGSAFSQGALETPPSQSLPLWLPLHSGDSQRREMPGTGGQGPGQESRLCPWAHARQATTLAGASGSSNVGRRHQVNAEFLPP